MRTIPIDQISDDTPLASGRQKAFLGDIANPNKFSGLSGGHRISIRRGLKRVREGTHVLTAGDARAELTRSLKMAERVEAPADES
jgi:hypothetical protein